jgi:two-component system, NtrC family, nitrogen regulation sensor histidine kinase GlnL
MTDTAELSGTEVIANLPLPLFVINSCNIITLANEACEGIFGRSRRNMEGQPATMLLRFSNARMARALDEKEGDISAQDMELIVNDNAIIADVSICQLNDRSDYRIVILSPRNGGRIQINQKQSIPSPQNMGAPAILGHEIKNPLAGIKGAAQLLAKRISNQDQQLTDLIVNEVDRIAKLLDQMQNLGNAKLGNVEPANIHLVIERAIRSIRAANKHIPDFSINYDPSLPNVLIDADAMVQIIINLLQNAIDALSGVENAIVGIGTRYIMSGALRDASGGPGAIKLPIEICISDNGPGVSKNIEADVFAPFITTKRDGQGLGLAIVHKLITQMNSRIVYERNDDKGLTQFRLYLPVATGDLA